MGCCKSERKCFSGKKTKAVCVFYDGELPDFSELKEEDCVTVEETIEELYKLLDKEKEQLSLKALGKNCIDYEEAKKKDIKVNEALLKHEQELCILKDRVKAVEGRNCCTDITSWKLDPKCLEDECETGFCTLPVLLQKIINKICD